MNTPIHTFLTTHAEKNTVRLHMPGHKGHTFLGPEPLDLTEIDGADVLYHENGIIEQSQRNAATLFGTGRTLYSTEGSTLAIKAMLFAASRGVPTPRRRILAARNVHKAFVFGCALLDLDVEWLFADEKTEVEPSATAHYLTARVTAAQVDAALRENASFCAVYLTSPDYLGAVSDVEGIANVCHKYGVPLLVDNAHGAYLAFLEPSRHPIALGADMCADSAHKTLPVLTGGAYLHVSERAPKEFASNALSGLRLFASTSPSYLVLASLDLCNAYIGDEGKEMRRRLRRAVDLAGGISTLCRELDLPLIQSDEPLKICLSLGGDDLDTFRSILARHGVVPEMCNGEVAVFMISTETTQEDADALKEVLRELAAYPLKSPKVCATLKHAPPRAMSIRDAVLAPSETVSTKNALGRVCAAPTVACPPAVPIVISGEVLTEEAIDALLCNGYGDIEVVKNVETGNCRG